jgi:two-component sensor histidine kinase
MKYSLLLILSVFFVFGCRNLSAQEVSGPESILGQLRIELNEGSDETGVRLRCYGNAIKKLTYRGNYKEADSVYKSIPPNFLRQKEDSLYIAEIDKTVAFLNRVIGRYSISLEIYLNLLAYYIRIDDKDNIALSYCYLGEFHRARRKYEPAAKYLTQAKLIIDENKVSNSTIAYWYSRKAAIQNERYKRSDSTLYYAFRGLELATAEEAYYTKALLLNEIGFSSARLGAVPEDEIVGYYEKSLAIMLEKEHYLDFFLINNNLAYYYMEKKEFEKALVLLKKPIKMAEENSWDIGLEVNYRRLSQTLAALGQMEESHEFRRKSYQLQLINVTNKAAIAVEELSATYDKDLAEENLIIQKLATGNAQKEALLNRRALIATILVSFLLLCFALLSYILYTRNKKKTVKLAGQQVIIQESNGQLQNALNQTKVLYRELNHRVKNNLSVLSSLVYLQEYGEKEVGQKKIYEALRYRIQSIALVHDNLYVYNETSNINFQEYLSQLIPNIAEVQDPGHEISYHIECKELILEVDDAIPLAMIINELITNSLKHAFQDKSKGQINLIMQVEDRKRVIYYNDNGSGFNTSEKPDPKSLGMRLIKLLAKQLKSILTYEGSNEGAKFRIELPEV